MDSLYTEFKGKEYLEQWERVKRWYEKLTLVKSGYYKTYDHKELLDVVYAYFMNVQHLKDWIQGHFEEKPETIKALRNLYKKDCFVICADFINNHKHYKRNALGMKNAKDPTSSIRHQNVQVTVGPLIIALSESSRIELVASEKLRSELSAGAKYSWDIVHSDKKHDAYEIAKKCIDEIHSFLESNRMLS